MDLAIDLAFNRELAPELDIYLTFDNDLAFARDLAHELDYEHDIDLTLARKLERAIHHARERAIHLTYFRVRDQVESKIFSTLITCIDALHPCTEFLALGSNRTILIQINESYKKLYTAALDEALYLQSQPNNVQQSNILNLVVSVLWQTYGDKVRYITLEGLRRITPDNLANEIAPYLQALQDFGRIHSELTGQEFAELKITQLHNQEVKVELNIGDFIRAIIEIFQFRKRKQEAQLRELEIEERRLTLKVQQEKNTIELAHLKLRSKSISLIEDAKLQTILSEAEQAATETEKKRLEVSKMHEIAKAQVRETYLQIANDYVEKNAPDLEIERRLPLVLQLAETLMRMGTSPITPRIGWHDIPQARLSYSEDSEDEKSDDDTSFD